MSLKSFNQWELKGRLGQGGFGEVLRWCHSSGTEVATKRLINVNLSADEQSKLYERWKQEYKWTRELKHSHIVPGVHLEDKHEDFVKYLNSQHDCTLPVIILEYCNGGDVRRQLQRAENINGLPELEVREILRALRLAIEFLHNDCGIFHRDIKPDNIVIHRDGSGRKHYLLTDFGFARRAPEMTAKQSVVGTPHYFAPEIIDTAKYNNKVDYWSLGVIAYELCCGVLPFIPHQDLYQIIVNIRKKERNCIAITEDPEKPEHFISHNKLPVANTLSKIWATKLIPWLRSALDFDYKTRGIFNTTEATDEVQNPNIFVTLDQLLECKILTAFSPCTYQHLAYEVTPAMTEYDLFNLIAKDTGIAKEWMYLVRPSGHPLKHRTPQTRAIDYYVANWQDSSDHPVMLYIFDVSPNCNHSPPEPHLLGGMQYGMRAKEGTLPNWFAKSLIRETHYLLNKEQCYLKMFMSGLKEYALNLEDEVLNYKLFIGQLNAQLLKLSGAIEFTKDLHKTSDENIKKLHRDDSTHLAWEEARKKLYSKYDGVVKSIESISTHYESTLRNLGDQIKKSLYKDKIEEDVFNVEQFRDRYIRHMSDVNPIEFRDKVITAYAINRHNFLDDKSINRARDSIHKCHSRFFTLRESIKSAQKCLLEVREELLELHQRLFKIIEVKPVMNQLNNSMHRMSISGDKFVEFDSLQTSNIIAEALKTQKLLEFSMDTSM